MKTSTTALFELHLFFLPCQYVNLLILRGKLLHDGLQLLCALLVLCLALELLLLLDELRVLSQFSKRALSL